MLKAFDVVNDGGEVVALVNAQTLRNPYSQTRKALARLVAEFGTVEELGACFATSERPTDVEVTLIHLKKPATNDRFSFRWENKSREQRGDLGLDDRSREVSSRDLIGTMLTQYDYVREHFLSLLREIDALKHYGAGLCQPGDYSRTAWKIARELLGNDGDRDKSYETQYVEFCEQMRQGIWSVVMDKINIKGLMTNAVRNNFAKFSQQTGYLDFTRENVLQLVDMVLSNKENILEVAIGDLFDKFTKHAHANRQPVDAWKTNSHFKVNRKVILPDWVEFGEFGNEFSIDSCNRTAYDDVDKVMCYLTGTNYNSALTISQALQGKFRELGKVYSGTFDNVCVSEFFHIRFFKKGTVHLIFRDERLHQEFNLRATAGKAWLPEEEMQAYQGRRSGPFPKAAPAPGTAAAAEAANPEHEAVLSRLLGPAATRQLAAPTGLRVVPQQPASPEEVADEPVSEQVQPMSVATPEPATPKSKARTTPPTSPPASVQFDLFGPADDWRKAA